MEHGMFGMNWYIEARDEIKEHLNEIIDSDCFGTSMARVLRLLCIATLTSGKLTYPNC